MESEHKMNNDHDLLIILNTKFDQMSKDIKGLADGTTVQLRDHERRIAAMEKLRDQIEPVVMKSQLEDLVEKDKTHDKNVKWIYTALFFLGSLVQYLISNVPHIISFFTK